MGTRRHVNMSWRESSATTHPPGDRRNPGADVPATRSSWGSAESTSRASPSRTSTPRHHETRPGRDRRGFWATARRHHQTERHAGSCAGRPNLTRSRPGHVSGWGVPDDATGPSAWAPGSAACASWRQRSGCQRGATERDRGTWQTGCFGEWYGFGMHAVKKWARLRICGVNQ
jgi:hypothetical protein